MRGFIERCSPELQEQLMATEPYRISHQRVKVGNTSIVETPDGWHIERTGERICNFAIRVEELLTTKSNGNFYRGTATAGETRYEFTVPVAAVDKRGLLPCVRDNLLERQETVVLFQPRWARRSLLVAFGFHQPKLIPDADRIGWDRNRKCFLFPKFALQRGGDMRTDLKPVAVDGQTPALNFEPLPGSWFCRNSPLAKASAETGVVWAMIAAVVHNIVAPTQNWRPHGIVLDGEGAQGIGRATAQALGCVEATIRRQRHVSLVQQIYAASHRHDWPVILNFPEGAKIHVATAWLDQPALHNVVLSVDRLASLGTACHPYFVRVHSPTPVGPLGKMQSAVSYVLLAYLQHLCERKLFLPGTRDHHVFTVLAGIADWVGGSDGPSKAVLNARKFLHVDSLNPWPNFLEVLLHMYAEGLLAVHYDHVRRNCPEIVFQQATEIRPAAVWIPALQINDIMLSQHAPPLDLCNVEAVLRNENVWLGIEVFRGDEMWMIDRAWFDEQTKKRGRRERQPNLGTDQEGASQPGTSFDELAPGEAAPDLELDPVGPAG